MLNPFQEVNWRPDRRESRRFAQSLVIGFPCIALLWLLMRRVSSGGWNLRQALYIGGTGLAVGLVLWALPGIARPFYLVWYGIACSIGIVVGNVLLGIIFYLFVTGIGLLRRTLGRSPIRKNINRQETSAWQDVTQPEDSRQYYRQF